MTVLTPPLECLLNYLATGQLYSGQQLGDFIGVSRTAIWKMINKLQHLGISIERIPNQGYRIYNGYRPLDEQKILAKIEKTSCQYLKQIIIKSVVDSTNNYLLKQHDISSGVVCIAEYQTAGRGRRNRRWQSVFGKNILMSLSWNFEQGSQAIIGLSMTVALAILRALQEYGLKDIDVKWPNDILWQEQKLAGVLIETHIDSMGICQVIIGIGVNVEKTNNQPVTHSTDIESIIGVLPDRNHLIGLILSHLLKIIPEFTQTGFAKYRDEWLLHDWLLEKNVVVQGLKDDVQGKVVGIDDQGGLMIQKNDHISTFYTGEISVRKSYDSFG